MLRQSALRRMAMFSTLTRSFRHPFQTMTQKELLHFIRNAQLDLTDYRKDHPSILKDLLDAQKALHPEFQVIALFARCVYACKAAEVAAEMGYRVVLVYDQSEASSLAPQRAHHVVIVESSSDVNCMINGLLEFCRDTGINPDQVCVDPGFDKLSESPSLAAACHQHGIKFSGPNAAAMTIAGDKAKMKELANSCLTFTELQTRTSLGIPGYTGSDQSLEKLTEVANSMGYPVILKDAHGGGGMGNTIVNNNSELEAALDRRKSPGKVKKVFIEKFLIDPFHIEVQVAISKSDYCLLGTRNCSDQINQQKVVEFAPAQHPKLDEIKVYADRMAAKLKEQAYEGLVTLEFLVDNHGMVYALEANPRIQVEHGITEKCLGISLILLKYWIAAGHSVGDFLLQEMKARHIQHSEAELQNPTLLAQKLTAESDTKVAVEVRVESIGYQSGRDNNIIKLDVCGEAYVIQHPKEAYMGIWNGSKINTYENNALIALLIGTGETEEEALRDILKQLNELNIVGIATNREWLAAYVKQILAHPEVDGNTGRVKVLNQHINLHQLNAAHDPTTLNLARLFKPTPGNLEASAKTLLPVKKALDERGCTSFHY